MVPDFHLLPLGFHRPAGRPGADAARQPHTPDVVFAPNHRLREQVTPAKRGRRGAETTDEPARHVSMTPDQVRGRLWAQRLKRVFEIDIETCEHCGGAAEMIASIEDPIVSKNILDHLGH